MENGDKFFTRGKLVAQSSQNSDGSRKSTATTVGTITGGTGKFAGMTGTFRWRRVQNRYISLAMGKVVSGRQIRAGRMLAGLTQAELARAAGCHPRSVRYWESKGNNLPTNVVSTLDTIEQALIQHGVIPFSTPKPGVRLR